MKVARLKEILDQYEARHPGIEIFWQLPAGAEQASIQPSIMLGIAFMDSQGQEAPFMIFRPLVQARYIMDFPGLCSQDIKRQDVHDNDEPSAFRG